MTPDVHDARAATFTVQRPLGILAALPEEHGDLLATMRAEGNVKTLTHGQRDYHAGSVHGAPCVVTLARIGKVAAAATACALIHEFDVSAIVFTGVAGGMGHDVQIGDIVIGDTLLQHDMDASPLFPRFEIPLLGRARFAAHEGITNQLAAACEQFIAEEGAALASHFRMALPSVHRGLVISGDQFVNNAQAIHALRASLPDALAIEMEGAAIAQVCHEYDVPFALVRTISDTADEHAGHAFSAFLTELAGAYSSGILKRFLTRGDTHHGSTTGTAAATAAARRDPPDL